MKANTNDEVKGKFHQVKGETKKELGKLNDPTLEGKDENKVGRVQRKTRPGRERSRKMTMPAV
jgi:uncharacterized protein YjbJ (UPF0337 family)